jgi:hypothetical protein
VRGVVDAIGLARDPDHVAPGARAVAWAAGLLSDVGVAAPHTASTPPGCDDVVGDWVRSGGVALTGRRDGPPMVPPGVGATAVEGALLALRTLAGDGCEPLAQLDASLLGERAAAGGLRRRAPSSPGGACRVLPAADGWVAVTLARADDVEALPALTGRSQGPDPWRQLAAWWRRQPVEESVATAALLGLAVAPLGAEGVLDEQLRDRARPDGSIPPAHVRLSGGARWSGAAAPLVVDLSALWAGPLCAHLLGLAGANVVKVESVRRPDGARRGPTLFYDLLHAGHTAVALDLAHPEGRADLARLLERADIVIEGSRPRALEQLGVDPPAYVAAGAVWVSITAYGRTGPWSNRVGFGDDTALAAGLWVVDPRSGRPLPCADAVADPLAGVHAAVAAYAILTAGRAAMVDVALRDVVAATLVPVVAQPVSRVHRRGRAWTVETSSGDTPVGPPRLRTPAGVAAPIGAHTDEVLRRLDVR